MRGGWLRIYWKGYCYGSVSVSMFASNALCTPTFLAALCAGRKGGRIRGEHLKR